MGSQICWKCLSIFCHLYRTKLTKAFHALCLFVGDQNTEAVLLLVLEPNQFQNQTWFKVDLLMNYWTLNSFPFIIIYPSIFPCSSFADSQIEISSWQWLWTSSIKLLYRLMTFLKIFIENYNPISIFLCSWQNLIWGKICIGWIFRTLKTVV